MFNEWEKVNVIHKAVPSSDSLPNPNTCFRWDSPVGFFTSSLWSFRDCVPSHRQRPRFVRYRLIKSLIVSVGRSSSSSFGHLLVALRVLSLLSHSTNVCQRQIYKAFLNKVNPFHLAYHQQGFQEFLHHRENQMHR
jgi:hypothetical protein